MRRLLSPVLIAVQCALVALVALLAYGLTAVRRGPVDERFMRERVVPLLTEKA